MSNTYLTTAELSARFKYDVRTIREQLIDSVLLEGRHYFRPFGGRKILFIWEHIEEDMRAMGPDPSAAAIPMANGSDAINPAANARKRAADSGAGKNGRAFSIPMSNGAACHG